MNKISILYIILFTSGSIFSMGHLDHEKKGLHPVAASGQVVVTYKADSLIDIFIFIPARFNF